MFDFLKDNAGTLLVASVVAVIVVLAFIRMRRDKKKGGCCGGCSGCPSAGICHINSDKKDNP